MHNTPIANRKNIVIVGKRNSGKSTLFNKLIGQEKSIVSDVAGTTTDPVWKAMELIGYGPVKITDTAGFDDVGDLGKMRVEKTEKEIQNADLIIHAISIEDFSGLNKENFVTEITKKIDKFKEKYKKLKKEYIFLISKCEIVKEILVDVNKEEINNLEENIIFGSNLSNLVFYDKRSYIDILHEKIIKLLSNIEEDKNLLDGLLRKGQTALLVIPIDSEAPAKRLILPQVQVIRECLDLGIQVVITNEVQLKDAIENTKNIDLVITDSQVFKLVSDTLPENLKLTSFSILFARQKGDIDEFVKAANFIDKLEDGDIVLISESCTHTLSHEDIGTVKIPKLIKKKTNKDIKFEFSHGPTIKDDLSKYALIIQCGGCMITRTNMLNRIEQAKDKGIPITNYGVVLSYLNGILEKVVY